MSTWFNVKHNHILQNPNRARPKTNKKNEKAMTSYLSLLIKEKKDWLTKWIEKEKIKAKAKLSKYWINDLMVKDRIKEKWLKLKI
jgi:hypothetical protein